MKFVLRRMAVAALQLGLLSVAGFVCFSLVPGDVYSEELANPQISAETIAALRHARGLDESWVRRYGHWAASCARGEFGVSLAFGIPVSELIAPRLPRTFFLAGPALLLGWTLGIGGALIASRWGIRWVVEPGVAAAGMVPDVIAVSLLLWLAVWAGVSISGFWLPLAALTLTLAPVVFLHASGALAEARELEFVRMASARGLTGRRFWFGYVLPAAANPLVSLAGLSIAAVIGSSFVIEALSGWPGLGLLFLEAVQARDYPVVQTVLLMLAAILALTNALADVALYRLDPRIRAASQANVI